MIDFESCLVSKFGLFCPGLLQVTLAYVVLSPLHRVFPSMSECVVLCKYKSEIRHMTLLESFPSFTSSFL